MTPEEKVEHLRHIIDRDRYIVAACIGAINKAIHSHSWLLDGRGPYEWDDNDYRREFGAAIENIEESVKPLRIVAWDKSDCATDSERVQAARQAAKEMLLSEPPKHTAIITPELGLPCPFCSTPQPKYERFSDGTLKPFIEPHRYDELRSDDRFLYNRGPKPEGLT